MSENNKTFIVTLKESASPEKFKTFINGLGGEIKHEYNLIKGFAVKLPEVGISSLHSSDAVATVEEDKEVKTQA